MKKIFILFLITLLACNFTFAKKQQGTVKIQFQSSYHGNTDVSRYKLMIISNNVVKIETIGDAPYENAPQETIYLDFNNDKWYQTALVYTGERYTTEFEIKEGINWEVRDTTAKIQGFLCKNGHLVVNSNHINIWYTEEVDFRGTIQPRYGIPNGVVLKIDINGNRIEEAVRISHEKETVDLLPNDWGKIIEGKYYAKTLNETGVISINIFDNEIIEFNPDIEKPVGFDEDKVYRVGNGAVLLKKVQLPESAKDYNIFLELIHHAEKDAYDRTGSIFLIPVDKKRTFLEAFIHGLDTLPSVVLTENGVKFSGIVATEDYNPPIELMRFFTSFGAHGYGYLSYGDLQWNDSVTFKQEVTHVSQYLEKEAWIGVCIGNWTKEAHRVTLNLKYYPEGKGGTYKAIPLFFAMNVLEMQWQEMPELFDNDAFQFSYTLPEGINESMLCYLSTGHGGWEGGDEFNQKINSIFSDNESILQYIPWREDCATYRSLNPASGNFRNGLSSSDLSRSGWCPGTITNPVYAPMPKLTKGTHILKIAIPQGAPEGNSKSHWSVSGTLIYK
ncbi:MAG: hypothetical protein LBH92_05745 [Bacteroidales bacterium]|jgi:hypothetical protein|nr:hypothetical protein [Bacteroidales bacterium]